MKEYVPKVLVAQTLTKRDQIVYCIRVKQTEFNPMSFVSWSVYPKGQEFDAEYFTSEDHAVDVAYSWSAEEHGKTMIVARNDMMWMEVSC